MSREYICNPINVPYRYQFIRPRVQGINAKVAVQVAREAADPSLIFFKGKYYIFASMTLSVWVSDDLTHWKSYRLPENLPLYDYAPDARVWGDYVYFCASSKEHICNFYRTKDVLNGPYEKIEGSFSFWDPDLFVDDDGRVYFYWGCSSSTPLYGVELDPISMAPLGEKASLIYGDAWTKGYERNGDNHCKPPCPDGEIEIMYQDFLKSVKADESQISDDMKLQIYGFVSQKPFIEGAWMNKYQGRYYLQYACPGTEYNIYCDGVYVSDTPLGPFRLAKNNPYSYRPGGFIPGAGHGSTMWDRNDNLWHVSTMTIGVNHSFERRVGIWKAGFDEDGELFCNQRYGDWPMGIAQEKMDPWENPDWYLLSYGKKAVASSFEPGKEPEKAVDENVRTWWRAETNESGQWISVDLGDIYKVHAIQINFADDVISISVPGEITGGTQARYIEEKEQITRWILEGSQDGVNYFLIEDKSQVQTNLPHDLVIREAGEKIQFLKLTILSIPYDQKPCISGFRVFGVGSGEKPEKPVFHVKRLSTLDMKVEMHADGALGYNILWGHTPEKLYHSYMVFGKEEQEIGALVKEESYFVRVDAFNENGITEGKVIDLL